jgi:hypothetical protein
MLKSFVAFFKLMLAFAPWLAFLFIAHGSLLRLKAGLAVALALSVAMGVARLHRGVILWVGLAFFTYATAAVFLFEDTWTIKHMGILASGALAAGTWLTVLRGRPFTLDYAREHAPPCKWSDPVFIRTNKLLSSAWATTFTVNAVLAWGKANVGVLPELAYELISYAFMVGTAIFTAWYPAHLRCAASAREETFQRRI